MKHKLQTLLKHNWRTLLLLLTLITASQEVWGHNEYNRDIIYIDAKDFTDFYKDGCKADLAVYNNWDCNSGEYKYSALSRLGNDTYVSYHSIKDTYGKSNARGFKVARCDDWYNWTGNLGRVDGSSDNCIKINGWGSGYWSKYVLEPTSVSLTVTDAKSGSGTSDDPYIVDAGASFTLSATPVYPITDSYMVTRYYFGTNDYNTPTSETSTSTQTASSSGGVTTRYYVSARGSYDNTYTSPATHVSASVYVLTETAATFAEGDVIWLDINHSGNDGWGVTSDERMYVNLDPSNNTTTRAMTKVAQNTNEKNSLWVYRFTAADQSLNKSAIKFQRGNSSTGRWDLSAEFKASDLTSYNGIYINNDGWQGVGTKFNFTTSNNVVSTPTLTMKDGAGSGEISSCTSGETVKFYESTQTITTTISGTSEARTLINPLYTYTFSKGSYSSGQTIDNPHSWTTGDTYLGSGTAKVNITFAIDGNSTPTPASSISSEYAKGSVGTSFTVNASCTAPTAQSVYIGDGSSTSKTICSTGNTFVRLSASQNGYSYQLKIQNGDSWDDVGDAWSSTGTDSHDFTDLNTAGFYKITGYPTSTPSSCNADMSNTVTLNVDAESVAGSITGAGAICSGESKTLGVSGNTGTVTQWKSSATPDGTYSDISGATEPTYSASPESTTYYKVVVKNGVCDAVTSISYATVTVNPAATAAEYPIKSGTDTKSYTGSSQGVTIKPVSGTGTYTVYYTGTGGTSYDKSSDAPTNVGKYSVTVDAQKGTSYCAANNLDVGILTITAAAPNITMGAISNACGTGAYNISGLASSNSSGAITYSVVGGTGTANINVTTLSVTAVGTVTIRASQAASGNYSAGSQDKTFTFAAAPVAGFSASADAETLEFSNTEYVPTTLRTDANSEWDFKWVCDSHPTWGTNNTPTIVSSTSNSTEVRFPIEGVYTFHVGAKCKKDNSYVSSSTVTVTVKLPLCIKGPLTDSNGSWNSYELISNISNSNTRTYSFTAFNKGTNIREFVLDASASGDDKHHIHTSSTVGNLALTGLDYNSGNHYNLRALESLGISESGTRVVLTITHNGGYYYNLSLALDCTTPEAKTISISASSVCEGESANVIVGSSQSGYIYTVYDSNSGVAGSGTGTGSDLNISVTPSAGTTYTVKAKQADACLETSMANTVDISVNERPSFTPSTGITQYAPVTVTSTALSPSWSIASKDPDVDAAWISTTSGSSTVLKAPTGTYTVSDGGPCPTNAIVVSNDTEICN